MAKTNPESIQSIVQKVQRSTNAVIVHNFSHQEEKPVLNSSVMQRTIISIHIKQMNLIYITCITTKPLDSLIVHGS